MKQEDIEKAAKSYQEKDHDIWTDKGITTELQKAFKAGAEWRINSVWHPTTVIPECYCFVVFLPKKSTIGSKNSIMGGAGREQSFCIQPSRMYFIQIL